ncbi:MAG: DNA mismatch repair endonuclease MutL [Elusimicrobiaceae bacterium]|nr:DNA mismatch repair endonuclease MutL [Elusimicrobiaceae bacterium]
MSSIHVLDESTAGQIAAGEVIERPAGVLKELLENAVDAGATAVHIDIEGAGRELIRVNDNGRGMDEQDLKLSVLRHATSKITRFADLASLHTFGFRGEALYSVAAVSQMRITSCMQNGAGHCLEIHGGKEIALRPAPSIQGTTVEIRELFYNVPARLKFLKSDSYERACLLKVIEESALANLNVGYHVTVNGREVYHLPVETGAFNEAVINRARYIMGPEVADSLVFKEFDELGLQLFLTPADKLVHVRDLQYTFVNRRPIDSKTIKQAIYKAYQNARGQNSHPAFLIYMTLPPAAFDVNIHPQKRDVRFEDEHAVFYTLMKDAGETIFSNGRPVEVTAPQVTIDLPQPAKPAAEKLFTPIPAQRTSERTISESVAFTPKATPNTFALKKTPITLQQELFEQQTPNTPEDNGGVEVFNQAAVPVKQEPHWYHGPYHYLGQLQRSYLLFENPQGLVLIDQHAAQERVLFEHYLDLFEKQQVQVQKLLFPVHVDLAPSNIESLLSWKDWLKQSGFEIEPFSARTILVKTMPNVVRFKEDDMKAFIVSLAAVVGDPSKSTDTLKRKMIAMLACKRAIKAHDALTAQEAEALLENMKKCKDGMHCPHGRPVLAQLGIEEIGKLFGR